MNITIICVGKIKEAFYRDAIAEYAKRLSAYCTFKVCEVDDEPDTGSSEAAIETAKEREAERILKNIKPGMHVITLEIKGKKYSSETFSAMLSDLFVSGKSDIAFVIGGSNGLAEIALGTKEETKVYSHQPDPDRWYYEVEELTRLFLEDAKDEIDGRHEIIRNTVDTMCRLRASAGIRFPGDPE